MDTESQRAKELAILSILDEADVPLSGAALEARLQEQGYELSERTIRRYLQRFDAEWNLTGFSIILKCGNGL